MWKRRRRSGEAANPVRVVDLPDRRLKSYLVCLEDWSSEMQDAGDHKARWYEKTRDQGLTVKLAIDDEDRHLGMIQYGPIELRLVHLSARKEGGRRGRTGQRDRHGAARRGRG